MFSDHYSITVTVTDQNNIWHSDTIPLAVSNTVSHTDIVTIPICNANALENAYTELESFATGNSVWLSYLNFDSH